MHCIPINIDHENHISNIVQIKYTENGKLDLFTESEYLFNRLNNYYEETDFKPIKAKILIFASTKKSPKEEIFYLLSQILAFLTDPHHSFAISLKEALKREKPLNLGILDLVFILNTKETIDLVNFLLQNPTKNMLTDDFDLRNKLKIFIPYINIKKHPFYKEYELNKAGSRTKKKKLINF